MSRKIALGGRNWEILLLLAVGPEVAARGRHAARHHIVVTTGPAADAGSPMHLLRCSPEALHSVLARYLAGPELSRTHQAILAWRQALSPDQLDAVLQSDIRRLTTRPTPQAQPHRLQLRRSSLLRSIAHCAHIGSCAPPRPHMRTGISASS